MRMEFVGSTSDGGNCPSLYRTERGTYIVQGDAVTDPDTLAHARTVLPGEAFVEVPAELFRFAPQAAE